MKLFRSGTKLKSKTTRVRPVFGLILLLTLFEAGVVYWVNSTSPPAGSSTLVQPNSPVRPGAVLGQDAVEHFTSAEASALIRHNYPAGVPGEGIGITKISFRYRTQLPDGQMITIHGRAYLPDNGLNNLPIFAFGPGTTGIGDQCAASLEKPAVANWGNYDAHMSAYATQGYAVVTTDYEGMRDPDRVHHYMVGELEGRALLDAVRGLRHLPQSQSRLSPVNVFLAGYSQGGHAAFWADKIANRYAPDVRPLGVVGFGPVMSVKQTLADVTHGANINWFGPDVLRSYQDYYKQTYPGVILPTRELNLAAAVDAHCIDTDLSYWGHVPAAIYTPEFIQSALAGDVSAHYPQFGQALDDNEVGAVSTSSAKRINEGARDNVVLPSQQAAALPKLCASSIGPVQYALYPGATHYDDMLRSFGDTVAWMRALANHQPVPSTCS